MSRKQLAFTIVVLAMLAVPGTMAVAQSPEASEPSPGAEPSPVELRASLMQVDVTLQEWAVIPETQTIPAGAITFAARNVGPMDPHELVVVRTDIPAAELPTTETGAFDEDAEGVEVIGEIEEFPVGEIRSMTLDLEPGHYVLLCNLVEEEEGETEAHYRLGMFVDVEVTESVSSV